MAFDTTNVTAKLLWQPKAIEDFTAKLTIKQRDKVGPDFKGMVSGTDYFKHEMDYNQAVAARHQNTKNTKVCLSLVYKN